MKLKETFRIIFLAGQNYGTAIMEGEATPSGFEKWYEKYGKELEKLMTEETKDDNIN